MNHTIHYFNQESVDPKYYFSINGVINKQKHTLLSAKWLFSATSFDLGTRILLKHFSFQQIKHISLLDLGCGYGLVSSFLTQQHANNIFPKIQNIHIDACDSSPLAVDLTTTNLKNLKNPAMTYKVICSDLLTDKYFTNKTYNTIIINPPFSAGKATVKNFIKTAYDHLEEGGLLWIVIPTNKWAKGYVSLCQAEYGKNKTQIIALEAGYRIRTVTK